MRIFITSTPEELKPHQVAACGVVSELGHQPLLREPARDDSRNPVSACAHQVQGADAVLAIVGHRRGSIPAPGHGGDGFHPWAWWETRAAFDRGLPVTVLMASDTWRPELREPKANARAVMSDFRGELARLAISFHGDPGHGFRGLVQQQLTAASNITFSNAATLALGSELTIRAKPGETKLRNWPSPELPAKPYPVLLPYVHPDLLAGRNRELGELRRLLALPVPILGLHAPSGTGKSSFLYAGLVQRLRAEGSPVAFDRHPCEPGIAHRLLGDLIDGDESKITDDVPYTFIDRLGDVLQLAKRPPLLILDQFEDLLRLDDAGHARAVLGRLLAASVQRQPGLMELPCRWLLAYRQEFHGEVFQWLTDVLIDARRESLPSTSSGRTAGSSSSPNQDDIALPHDLSGSERFHSWPLLPLATPPPGTSDRIGAAAQVFQEAIEKPLTLKSAGGKPVYPWHFEIDGAKRLARSFAEARVAQRNAPLAPELQVVLAYLQDVSWRVNEDGVVMIDVPKDPAELIDQALEQHLKRSLDLAFPVGKTAPTKLRRTRALLALRELADIHGHRDEGRSVTSLARAIGPDGQEILENLATPQARLVLLERHGDEKVYVLSHDRLAELIVRLVDAEGAYAGLGVDAELLGLRRFVTLQRELFSTGEVEQSTEVPEDHFSRIERHIEALIWDTEGQRWWQACRKKRQFDRRRRIVRRGAATAAFMFLTLLVAAWTHGYFKRQTLLQQVGLVEPEAAFSALATLSASSKSDSEELLRQIRKRKNPFDILERGLGGVDEEKRGPAVLRVTEILLSLLREAPKDPVRIASTVWALDAYAAPDPTLKQPALFLRDEVLRRLRQSHPPPTLPAAADPEWAHIPAGAFLMGSGLGEGRDGDDHVDERPQHPVQLSAFRLLVHEVTRAEFRRLFPHFEGEDSLPAVRMTWYEAYTYAAWLGGRLPTEAEWEYAARSDCDYPYCQRDGSEATLEEVAWWVGNSVDPETETPNLKPVMQRQPNQWGLYDIFGNAYELTASWYGTYPEKLEVDPFGPTASAGNIRIARGGSIDDPAQWIAAPGRGGGIADGRYQAYGFRVALPTYLDPAGSSTAVQETMPGSVD